MGGYFPFEPMLYAITDRHLFGSEKSQYERRLVEQAGIWATHGVSFVQLREKDLGPRDQVVLARAMLRAIQAVAKDCQDTRTLLLVNGRTDVAIASGADGVHLPADPDTLTPAEVKSVFASVGHSAPVISVSCHSLAEVERARQQNANCILFAPVFEKVIGSGSISERLPGTGLELLKQACQLAAPVPVYALGGMTEQNTAECLQVGASGIAAIRWLHEPAPSWMHVAQK